MFRLQDDTENEDPDDTGDEGESTDESDDDNEDIISMITPHGDPDKSNIASEYFDSNDEDDREAPRDNTDIISSDEDIEEGDEQTSTYSAIVNNITNILSNCRKMVSKINRSSMLYELIQNLARPTVNTDLILDMHVRWNSTCKMISRLLQYRSIITVFMEKLLSLQGVTSKQKQE